MISRYIFGLVMSIEAERAELLFAEAAEFMWIGWYRKLGFCMAFWPFCWFLTVRFFLSVLVIFILVSFLGTDTFSSQIQTINEPLQGKIWQNI
jgi:hypothetical protein